jgi:CRISPR-associated endonuclease/helicase Cas3
LKIAPERELAPRPRALYEALVRVAVEVLPGKQDDVVLADAFVQAPQMLCIVNSRAHARDIFERIRGLAGAVHLTTLMCGAHRRQVLRGLRARLSRGLPVRLVATSLIEAGVDISFPEVWRAMTGLDSIAQDAGRCNRNGELWPCLGRLVVFDPADAKPPAALLAFQQVARPILRDSTDPLGLDAVRDYFRALYAQKGFRALDSKFVGDRQGILAALEEGGPGWRFPFEGIADAFRMIDEAMRPVVVPWGGGIARLERLARSQGSPGGLLRRLQPYTVGIPARVHADWLAAGVLVPARRDLGEAVLRLDKLRPLYTRATGLDLSNPAYRSSEENIW